MRRHFIQHLQRPVVAVAAPDRRRYDDMKIFLNLISFLILLGCSTSEEQLSVSIEKRNQHPFLVDHDRVLVAIADDHKIDELPVYSDSGAGCALYYVELKDEIIAIDCNGMWYRITKKGIKKIGWKWYEPLPKGKVQRIIRNERDVYVTEQLNNISLSDVYRFKDPDESSSR